MLVTFLFAFALIKHLARKGWSGLQCKRECRPGIRGSMVAGVWEPWLDTASVVRKWREEMKWGHVLKVAWLGPSGTCPCGTFHIQATKGLYQVDRGKFGLSHPCGAHHPFSFAGVPFRSNHRVKPLHQMPSLLAYQLDPESPNLQNCEKHTCVTYKLLRLWYFVIVA